MAEPIKVEEPVTLSRLAALLGIGRTNIYRHVYDGNLKARKLGALTVVDPAEVERFTKRVTKIRYGSRMALVYE